MLFIIGGLFYKCKGSVALHNTLLRSCVRHNLSICWIHYKTSLFSVNQNLQPSAGKMSKDLKQVVFVIEGFSKFSFPGKLVGWHIGSC